MWQGQGGRKGALYKQGVQAGDSRKRHNMPKTEGCRIALGSEVGAQETPNSWEWGGCGEKRAGRKRQVEVPEK